MRRTKAVLAVLGCLAATCYGVLAGPAPVAASSGDPLSNQAAFDFFLDRGLTDYQAAGIVGNLDQESGMDPAAVQSGGAGRGIAQWSAGGRWDTSSQDNVKWYASSQGESYLSLELQLEFIWYELSQFSGYGLADLQAAGNVTDATIAFQNDYERCGGCAQSTRIGYAQDALSAYGSDAPPNARFGMSVGGADRQHIFVSTSTGAVAQRYENASGWTWDSIDGTVLTGSPAVNYYPDTNEYDVYATGTNGNLYVKEYRNGAWACCWTQIAGPALRPGLSAMIDKYGHQHVFASGTNGAVYNIRDTTAGPDGKNGSWTFSNIGGTILTGTPAVNYFSADNIYNVYATGTNGHLYVKEYDGSSWDSSWTDLGDHNFTHGASAMVDKGNHQHVFAVNDSGAVVNVRNLDTGPDGDHGSFSYDNIGGTVLTSTPKLQYVPSSNTYNVWAVGTDGILWHKEYADGAWWPSYHNFSGTTSIVATG